MKQIGLGVVGLRFGLSVVDTQIVKGPGASFFKLQAICDQDPARLAMVSGRHPGISAYTSLDEMLQNDSVRVVALFSGPNGRAEILRRIIRSGRDVITTKPFEMNPAKAASILREAHSLRRIIHLNSPSPVLPGDLQTLHEWRSRYDLGRPITASVQIWYLGNHEKPDGSWYDNPDLCPGGVMLRLGIYGINDLLQIFEDPIEVQATGSRIRTGRPTPDLASLSIRFRDGGIAQVTTALCLERGYGGKAFLSVVFERGVVYRNAPFHKTTLSAEGNIMSVIAGTGEHCRAETREVADSSGLYQWEAFYDSVVHRGEPLSLYAQKIVDGSCVIDAMARAFKSGRCEQIQPVSMDEETPLSREIP